MNRQQMKACGTWWNGETEQERFLLYYLCLRHCYGMPASEALKTAKTNWSQFGPNGDLMATLREAIGKKGETR